MWKSVNSLICDHCLWRYVPFLQLDIYVFTCHELSVCSHRHPDQLLSIELCFTCFTDEWMTWHLCIQLTLISSLLVLPIRWFLCFLFKLLLQWIASATLNHNVHFILQKKKPKEERRRIDGIVCFALIGFYHLCRLWFPSSMVDFAVQTVRWISSSRKRKERKHRVSNIELEKNLIDL